MLENWKFRKKIRIWKLKNYVILLFSKVNDVLKSFFIFNHYSCYTRTRPHHLSIETYIISG